MGGGVFNNTNSIFVAVNLTIASNSCISPFNPSNSVFAPGSTNGFVAGSQIAITNGTLHLYNTLVAGGGTNSNAYGPITDDGYNISSDGSANFNSGSSYNFTDPLLGPLANYGGPTLCMALRPDSPAIDSGSSAGAPATDQRGFSRPHGAAVDVGAYEYYSDQTDIPYLYIAPTANNFLLTFTAYPSGLYDLQASTNLSTWTDLVTNGPFDTLTNVNQTISKQNPDHCFYRLLLQ